MNRIVLLLLIGLTPLTLHADELPDSYAAKPAVYKKLLENDSVRMLEMTLNPGEEIPMHAHVWPHFVYILEAGQVMSTAPDGTERIADAAAGQVIWMEAKPHALKNTGDTVLRAVVGEIKKA